MWELLYSRRELPLVQGLRLLTSSIPAGLRISRAKTDAQIGGVGRMAGGKDGGREGWEGGRDNWEGRGTLLGVQSKLVIKLM